MRSAATRSTTRAAMVGMGLGTSTGTLARVVGGLGRASERKARVGFELHQPASSYTSGAARRVE